MTKRTLLWILAVPTLVAAALAIAMPLSLSGFGYVLAASSIVTGLATLHARKTRFRGVTRAGLLLLLAVSLGRIAFAQGTHVTTTTLPPGAPRLPEPVLDEQDVVVTAARAIVLTEYLRPSESAGLPEVLAERYAAMREAEGATTSPLLGTYVLGQDERSFDLVTVMPSVAPDALAPRAAILFLHGFAGNFVLPCWQLAQAAREIGAITVCPSTEWTGRWGHGPQGARIVAATIAWLRSRGVERIYLAGLSNGAIGAGDLAPRFARDIDGVIVISGGSRRAPPRGLPVLVVQGNRDTMTPPRLGRSYAARAGRRGRYVELPGNHFVFLGHHERARAAIAQWLREREFSATPRAAETGRR